VGRVERPQDLLRVARACHAYFVISDIVPTKNTLSYEETVAQLRERGLPPELIDHMRKAPPGADDLWPGENPDPYGMKNVTPKSDT
jgi:hypothetical protein